MTCYVYILRRECGEPFYVGKGRGARAWKHIREAQRGIDYNPHKSRIIRKMLAAGVDPVVEIAAEFETDEEAFTFEAKLIEKIGRLNMGTGPLVNITAGGDGVVGYPQTPAIRAAKRRGAQKRFSRPDQREWARDNLRQIHARPDARQKLSDAQARRWANGDERDRASATASAQWQDPETRQRTLDAQRTYASSQEGRQAARARHAALLATGFRARIRPVMVAGIRYSSLKDAAEAQGMKYKTLAMKFSRHQKADNFPDGWGYMDEVA